MSKKLILAVTVLFIVFASACSSKSVSSNADKKNSNNASDTISADKNKSSNVQEVKKEDDKIIQEAIDTMDDIKLDEINDGILNDSELDSILQEKDDPIGDIPVK